MDDPPVYHTRQIGMKFSRHPCVVSMDGYDEIRPEPESLGQAFPQRLAAPLRNAILRTRQWLLSEQHEPGYWVGELEGDTILESEYILLLAYLGRHD